MFCYVCIVCQIPSGESYPVYLITGCVTHLRHICATVPAMTVHVILCFRWLSALGVLLLYHQQRAGLVHDIFFDGKIVRFKHNNNKTTKTRKSSPLTRRRMALLTL